MKKKYGIARRVERGEKRKGGVVVVAVACGEGFVERPPRPRGDAARQRRWREVLFCGM